MIWVRTLLLLYVFDLPFASTASKPHIVIIIGDDLGYNDLSFHGSNQVPTPNIDALAYNGIILDKFYTQQSCTPSRTALLTGNYPIRAGMQGFPIAAGENRSIPTDMRTLPEALKELGYHTHLVGKWHQGAAYRKNLPTGRGFDSHFGYWNGFVGYYDYVVNEITKTLQIFPGFDLHDNLNPAWSDQGKYATDLFTQKSIEVIDKHNASEPLFLTIAHLAPHAGKNGIEMEVKDEAKMNKRFGYIKDINRRRYADIVHEMDKSVGDVIEKLSAKNMLENSIILFFADNGAQTSGLYQNYGSNWPLRGLKFSLHQGGVKSAAALYSPLLLKKGYLHKHLFHVSDWFPTFYSMAGGDVKKLGNIDGVDQWKSLSENQTTSREELLVNIDEVLGYSGIISKDGQYKLLNGSYRFGIYDLYEGESGRLSGIPKYNITDVLNSKTNIAIKKISSDRILSEAQIKDLRKSATIDNEKCNENRLFPKLCTRFCLFDLHEDPCETENLINQSSLSSVVQKLKGRLSYFYSQLMPQTNKPSDPNANPTKYNHTYCTWLDDSYCYKTNNFVK